MTLSNKRTLYNVQETGTNLSIDAQVNIAEQERELMFGGSFLGAENAYIGSFNYVEKQGIVSDKTINGVHKTLLAEAEALLDSTLTAIVTELNFN